MRLIAFAGRAGAGKDTAAAAVEGGHRVAFAGPLKQALAAMTDVPLEAFHDRDLKEHPVTRTGHSPRALMRWLGAAARFELGADFWVRRLSREIERCDEDLVVITDLRFANECAWVQARGGEVYFIDADARLGAASDDAAAIRFFPGVVTIENNGSVAEFLEKVSKQI